MKKSPSLLRGLAVWLFLNVTHLCTIKLRMLCSILFIQHIYPDILKSIAAKQKNANAVVWGVWCMYQVGMEGRRFVPGILYFKRMNLPISFNISYKTLNKYLTESDIQFQSSQFKQCNLNNFATSSPGKQTRKAPHHTTPNSKINQWLSV